MIFEHHSSNKKIIALIVILLATFLAAGVGSLFTTSSIDNWYAALAKPSFSPPNWVFAPVWTILYLLMALAAFLAWQKTTGRTRQVALSLYGLQLILNASWSIVFFGLHWPGVAVLVIIVLWISILWLMIFFYKLSRLATYLLVPYILWVSFAGFLNYSLWQLNPDTASLSGRACTMEAKLCPDGSAVGRSGLNCEFAACPTITGSGVAGQVLLSPICPVERIPPDPQCAPRPYVTKVEVQKNLGNGYIIIQTVATDSQGKYKVDLPPGNYILTAQGGQPLPHCASSGIEVTSNNYATITLECDTGIR